MTIAQFGRGLRFAQPSPFPVWARGAPYVFPSALGLIDLNLDVGAQPVTLDFTGPFLDLQTSMRVDFALEANLVTTITRRNKIRTEIDSQAFIPSTRITKDGTDY